MLAGGIYRPGATLNVRAASRTSSPMRNENAALKKGAATGITMNVSEKGGLSVCGMGRFPITVYEE